MNDSIQARKAEHLSLTATGDVEPVGGAGWDDVRLLHASLPEIDLDAVDCSQTFLGRRLRYPLVIAAMTGGFARGGEVNAILARAAETFDIAIGVGSQRAAVYNPDVVASFAAARTAAPTALLLANIGAPQLIDQPSATALTLEQIEAAIRMVGADALAVHLNYLQEVVQPEGDRRARGVTTALSRLVTALSVPVVAKETGAGITRQTAASLREAGVAAIDTGGGGGPSFAAVEGLRAAAQGDALHAGLGTLFHDWGIPTPVAVVEAATAGLPVIATGGVRSGLDAARAIALGATLVGVARPLLQCALEGPEAVEAWLHRFVAELRVALFLSGCATLAELRAHAPVVLGRTREWMLQLQAREAASGS